LVVGGVALICAGVLAWWSYGKMSGGKKNMDPKKWTKHKLISTEQLSPNVFKHVYELPNLSAPLGLPTGNHIKIRAMVNKEEVLRSYTPSEWRQNGKFDLIFKVYPNGKMTNYLKPLKVGDKIDVLGLTGKHTYIGQGKFQLLVKKKPIVHAYKALVLVCGGTGLTPMLQIAMHALDDPEDHTPIYFLFANSTVKDVFHKEEILALLKAHPKQFHPILAVSRPGKDAWGTDMPAGTWHTGRFNQDSLSQFLADGKLPKPDNSVGTAICGPPSFEKAMSSALDAVGYSKQEKTMRW